MKSSYASLLVAVFIVLAVSVNAFPHEEEDDCPKFCTYQYDPVCGFDGNCYQIFGNACALKNEQCTKNKDLKSIEMERCEEAKAKSNPEVKMCTVE